MSNHDEAQKFARTSTDATLTCVSGISWQDYEYFVEDPQSLAAPFLRNESSGLHIGVCELIAGALATPPWLTRHNKVRRIILRTDNVNEFSWLERARSKQGTVCRILRAFLQWCVTNDVEAIPLDIRSGRNLSAGGLKRWNDKEIPNWAAVRGMNRINAPCHGGSWRVILTRKATARY